MSELATNFNALERQINFRKFPVKDGEIMYAGGIGAVNTATGEAEMASDSASLVVGGRVESYVDNSNDGLSVNLKVGCFRWNNSEVNAVTNADLNKIVYIEDDNTIANDPGDNAVIAGVLVEIESGDAWVDNSPAAIAAASGDAGATGATGATGADGAAGADGADGSVPGGSYTVLEADDTAGTKDIVTGLSSIDSFSVQILRAGVDVSEDAVLSKAAGTITVADGAATYALTAGDVINWIAAGTV